ncbi:MAG: transglutaminase domain-containing protein [Roseobacter sp.]
MLYSIRLEIAHHYNQPAANSRHLISVVPKSIGQRQSLQSHLVDVFPKPGDRSNHMDFFENSGTSCTIMDAHDAMSIRLACHVNVTAPAPWLDLSPTLSELRRTWEKSTDLRPTSPLHFVGPTPRLTQDQDIADFAREVFDGRDSVAANVLRLGRALHDTMTFDATATTVDTDAAEAFRLKRGVCQDFSHIMILGLHALGIPAGYVSGYLRTLPPEGGVKLEGVDAMHAWVRAWCGTQQGWIEYDPTNATLVSADHIVVAYGRDYADVSPVRGQLRTSGGQRSSQAVDVKVLG